MPVNTSAALNAHSSRVAPSVKASLDVWEPHDEAAAFLRLHGVWVFQFHDSLASRVRRKKYTGKIDQGHRPIRENGSGRFGWNRRNQCS